MHPTPPGDSWRTWLMTGSRGGAADRRRVRGAHRGLKKILAEGATGEDEGPKPWKDFSSAMVRQAVNEALNRLPPDHKQAVKLAYFGGLSNREIGQQLGLSVGAVQRRLRDALARISDHLEHGRRALLVLIGWIAARVTLQALHRAPALLLIGVAAGSALALHQAAPATHAVVRPLAVARPHAAAVAPAAPSHAPVLATGVPAVPGVPQVLPSPPLELPPLPSVPALPTPKVP